MVEKRTYEIKEVLTGKPPALKWGLTYKGQVLDPAVPIIFDKDKDGIKKVDHYRIRFGIAKFGDSRLRFTPKKNDVLWVQKGEDCPTSHCAMPGVFYVDDMDDDGEWIDVINMDMVKEELWFTLNLVDKSDPTSTNYVPVDPGAGNQNGGEPGSDPTLDWLAPTALGFGAGLLAFFGARFFLTG